MMTGSSGEVISYLRDKRKFIITSHEKPDGDALGSSLALKRILIANGYEAVLVDFSPLAPRYHFMIEEGEINDCPTYDTLGADAFIVVDCGDNTRVGRTAAKLLDKFPVVNIDHHGSNSGFGEVDWINPDASSAGEMVYELCREWGLDIPPSAAEPLWVAISTDTGDFSFSNTNSRVMRIAADLLDLGAQPSHVRRNIQENMRYEELMMTKLCLDRLVVCDDMPVAYITLTEADFKQYNCGPQDLHEPIDLARSIKGVCVAVLAYENPGENRVKVSLRSYPPYDSSDLCTQFGGGGHPRAAGCSFYDTTVSAALPQVLEKIRLLFFNTEHIA